MKKQSVSSNPPCLNRFGFCSAGILLALFLFVAFPISSARADDVSPVDFTETGHYPNLIQVFMSTATSGATIFYTVSSIQPPSNPTHNGSTPTGSTYVYTGPYNVSIGFHRYFKAIAYKAGMTDSIVTWHDVHNTGD